MSNKSAYLCGVMKTYRQKTRAGPTAAAAAAAAANGPVQVRFAVVRGCQLTGPGKAV